MHTTTRTTTAAAAGLFAALILTGCGGTGVGQAGEPATTVTATVEPTETLEPGAGIPAECRDWIEGELLDATEGINAGTGYAACGDLSDDEMDQAVDAVTEELIAEGRTPGDQYGDGDYQVGEDIPAGTYETAGASAGGIGLCAITTEPAGGKLPQVKSAQESERVIITLDEEDGVVTVKGCEPLTPR